MKKKIYLAIPYSHPDPEVRNKRFALVNELAAKFFLKGFNVLSPISHSHPISLYMDNSNDGDFWINNSLEWLKNCDELCVYCLPGWTESKGVTREIKYAEENGIPITYVLDRISR